MASLALDSGLTLSPFRKMYGDVQGAALLANSFFSIPAPRAEADPDEEPDLLVPTIIALPNRVRFESAVAEWLEESEFDSLPDDMKDHESFKAIVQDGVQIVPLIAAHLRRSPSFLFLALEEIFEEDPVPEDAYGNLQTTVSAWLQWLQR